MTDQESSHRYQAWFDRDAGRFAMTRCRNLLHGLLSGWPRRSRSVLVFNAGSGDFIETLWEAGFEVTGQDSDPGYLAQARARLGKRADFVLSSPDHLPFDDCAFDYAVAVAALEFWDQPEAVLREMDRLTCSGVIVIFPNAWSLFGLECLLRKKNPLCATALPLLKGPFGMWRLARRVFGKRKKAWMSVLLGPSFTWTKLRLFSPLNAPRIPFPCGAFTGLRIDFGPLYTGTPLPLAASEPVPSNGALTRSSLLP